MADLKAGKVVVVVDDEDRENEGDLVCAADRGTPAASQREFARRAGKTVELDAGHHPFLSQPAEVRDLILAL